MKKTSAVVASINDEQAFWQDHDPADFLDMQDFADQFSDLKPSTKIITLRVPEHLLNNLKLIANKRDIPYQSLLKHFLQEKVNEELQTPFLKLRQNVSRKAVIAVVMLCATLAVGYGSVVSPIKAQGLSMAPNFPTNTYYLLDKFDYKLSAPQRGDVVVFHSPSQPNATFFKRIVGLPGEKISIRAGAVYVNGDKLPEAYAQGETSAKQFPQAAQELMVPGNSYYVLGDNRSESTDSRDFGFVTRENITGKVGVCYWNCK